MSFFGLVLALLNSVLFVTNNILHIYIAVNFLCTLVHMMKMKNLDPCGNKPASIKVA